MTLDVAYFAKAYNKPVDYVEKCIKYHGVDKSYGVKGIPRVRLPDDGLGPFFSDLSAYYDTSPSLTKQEFAAECDINNIMKRFIASAGDPSVLPMTVKKAMHGDFSEMPDSYHAALNYVVETKNLFMTLDADLRSKFENDPQQFLDFVSDPANQDEMIRLGLAVDSRPDLRPSDASLEASGARAPKSALKGVLKPSKAEGVDEGE